MTKISLLRIYQRDSVPPPLEIADAIAKEKISGKSSIEIKNSFDQLIDSFQKDAYDLYLEIERRKGVEAIKKFLYQMKEKNRINNIDQMINITAEHFNDYNEFFLSLSQSRRARAGATFEHFINILFAKLDYPYTRRPVINGEPDFLLPSVDYFRQYPTDCIIFTAKRTLRERWRQITTEGTHGLGFYLATIDEKLSNAQLDLMRANRINVVVPITLKERNYSNNLNVLSFREFFELHLDPAMKRWRRAGIVK